MSTPQKLVEDALFALCMDLLMQEGPWTPLQLEGFILGFLYKHPYIHQALELREKLEKAQELVGRLEAPANTTLATIAEALGFRPPLPEGPASIWFHPTLGAVDESSLQLAVFQRIRTLTRLEDK